MRRRPILEMFAVGLLPHDHGGGVVFFLSSCGLEADDRKIPTASTSLPFFPFARAKGGRDYRRMDSWCTFLFLLAFEGEEKMKDAPGK